MKMRKSRENKPRWVLFITVFFLEILFSVFTGEKAYASKLSSNMKPLSFQTANVSYEVSYGINGIVKYGRNMTFSIHAENQGKTQFEGKVQVMVDSDASDIICYEKKMLIAAGEEKKISFYIPLYGQEHTVTLCILNRNGEEIEHTDYRLDSYYLSNRLFIGTLSNQNDALSYLGNLETYVLPLTAEDIPEDVGELEQLDVLVIDSYNCRKLSKLQKDTIYQFVKEGGSLVLGTGEDTGALSVLDDMEISYTLGEQNIGKIGYGTSTDGLDSIKQKIAMYDSRREENLQQLNASNSGTNSIVHYTAAYEAFRTSYYDYFHVDEWNEKLDIVPYQTIQLENAISLINEQNISSIQKLSFGKGNILVFATSLALSREELQAAVLIDMVEHISSTKELQLENELYGNETDVRILSSIHSSGASVKINIVEYVVVFLCYLLLIGPVIFLILKKKDGLVYYWAAVPVCSIVFFCVVYNIGTKTRVSEPLLKYMNMVQINDNQAQQTTYFGITVPNDESYSFDNISTNQMNYLGDGCISYYDILSQKLDMIKKFRKDSVNLTFYDNHQKTGFRLSNYHPFSQINFSASQIKEISPSKRIIQDFYFTKEGLKGNLSNYLGVDLKNAVLLCDDFFYELGDISNQQTISLTDKSFDYFEEKTSLYSDSLLNRMDYGEDGYTTTVKKNIMNYVIEDLGFHKNGACYLIGFVEDHMHSTVMDELSEQISCEGLSTFIYQLDASSIFGREKWVLDLDPYGEVVEGQYMNTYEYRIMNSDSITFKYTLPKDDNVTSFSFLDIMNPEYDYENIVGFIGDILFYNFDTKQYDVIFTSSRPGTITNISSYRNQMNEVYIKYRAKEDSVEQFMTLPFVVYQKGGA